MSCNKLPNRNRRTHGTGENRRRRRRRVDFEIRKHTRFLYAARDARRTRNRRRRSKRVSCHYRNLPSSRENIVKAYCAERQLQRYLPPRYSACRYLKIEQLSKVATTGSVDGRATAPARYEAARSYASQRVPTSVRRIRTVDVHSTLGNERRSRNRTSTEDRLKKPLIG